MNHLLRLAAGLLAALSSCNQLAKQPAATHHVHHYQRIVIVGNSITRHPPRPEIGWNGDWGMAASARDSDFVHILTRRFKQEEATAVVKFLNIAEWERNYYRYNDAPLDTVKQFRPNLLIVRLGENVRGDSIGPYGFAKYFPRLLSHLATDSTRIVVAASFWSGNPATQLLRKMCDDRHIEFISLEGLDKPENKAIGQFVQEGVAQHPSNRGMRAIAETIWQRI